MIREIITSSENSKIKKYSKLSQKKYRDEFGLFVAEGFHIVEEAKKFGVIKEIFTTNEKLEGTLVTSAVMQKISQIESHQIILAVCELPKKEAVDLGDRVLALDGVQDPGNVGSLIRTAKSFGFTGVIVNGCDPYNPKSVRSTQGAIFLIPIVYTKNIIKHIGTRKLIGATLDQNAKTYNEYLPISPFVLILGSEGTGISNKVKEMLDVSVYIPINFESLNVLAAGAILINEYKK